jgi:hypothetical protein
MRSTLIDNHHGICNLQPLLKDKGPNQSKSMLITILSNASPQTSAVSCGLGNNDFAAQYFHSCNNINKTAILFAK